MYRPASRPPHSDDRFYKGAPFAAVPELHRRSPRSAILPRIPRPRDIGWASNLRKCHECLVWYQIRSRVELERMADQEVDGREGMSGAVRASTGGGGRAAAGAAGCTFLRCITRELVHPPAGKAYTSRAIACSPICWTEQQQPPRLAPAAGTSADYAARIPPLVALKHVCDITRVWARLYTCARARVRGGRKLTETGKLGATQWREPTRYRARNSPSRTWAQTTSGSRVPNNRLPGIDQPKRLLIQLGAPPCLQIAPHVTRRSKVTERRKGVQAS